MSPETTGGARSCPRCGWAVPVHVYEKHVRLCQRVPLPEELCDLLDEDDTLTTRAICLDYEVSYKFLMRRMEGTRWDKKRLRERGRHAVSNRLKRRPSRAKKPPTGPRCARCNILLEAVDEEPVVSAGQDEKICYHCIFELSTIRRRLETWAQREAAGLPAPSVVEYELNRQDLEFFRRYHPPRRSL